MDLSNIMDLSNRADLPFLFMIRYELKKESEVLVKIMSGLHQQSFEID